MTKPGPDAKNSLSDKGDDDFDFQEWYNEQLDDFQADQDNVAYDNDQDGDDDLEDLIRAPADDADLT